MKKKSLIIVLSVIICMIVYLVINNISITKNDDMFMNYTPQEELSENTSKETSITLYFLDVESDSLKPEGRSVNLNDLLKNPYKLIVEKLIEGPVEKKLQNTFPENTRLIDANLSNNCVSLNFSEEFLNFKNDIQKYNMINSILNSLTQLNEVDSIKILINGEIKDGLTQEYTSILENT